MRGIASKALQLASILGLGLLGALAAGSAGLPIPFLLGSLAVIATISLILYAKAGTRLWYPPLLRKASIAVIGTLIGTNFSPDILSMAPSLMITLSAMVLFVPVAQSVNYVIFRHIGRYDRVTAAYSAMPGGLIEAVTLGEKAGGDVETLSIQHFMRIILVIVFVPSLFLIFTGEAVGSAGGQTMERFPVDWVDWALIAVLAPIGLHLGERLKLPAGHLVGPLVLTAALQSSGFVDIQGPATLLNSAQLIVGAGLGTMFARSTLRRLIAAMGLGIVSVTITLGISAIFALVLTQWVPMSFEALLVSFAPGGVTEMSLVALSLGVSPVLVTTHHLFRILLTVSVASILTRRATTLNKPGNDT